MRRWPAIALSRSVWLFPQVLILAAFVLALVPQGAQLSVLAPIEVARAAPSLSASAPLLADAVIEAASGDKAATGTAWLYDLPQALALLWLAVYAGGALVYATRMVHARRVVARLVASSERLSRADLACHPGFNGLDVSALAVHETDTAVPPMLFGLKRPRLLLPRSLRSFSERQQQLIVAHELTHWHRRDPWLLHASIVLQTLFWFNPVLRALGERLNWAQELGCDRAVLAGRAAPERQQYAAALVAQLRLQQGGCRLAALAFGGVAANSLASRVCLIRDGAATTAHGSAKVLVLGMLATLLIGAGMLQPVFAWRAPEMPVAAISTPTMQWRAPLARPRVSSFYGVPRANRPAGHNGIDFAAPVGTPVLATAAGTVVDSTDRFDGGSQYGKVIVIEHAAGVRSTYAHLDQRSVMIGAVVVAGQQIGRSGATGKVSGAHLHLELSDGGRNIDPASLIAGLDLHAFPRALRTRDRAAIP